MDRRTFLATAGVMGVTGLAGCGSGGVGSSPNDGGGGGGGGGENGQWATIDEHPAAANMASQPHQGDLSTDVVIAFEDPSCPSCGRFHSNVVPKIRSNLVDAGEGAFVHRNYPIIYPWGEPASKALEAVHDRAPDSGAHWALQSHYYENQGQFSTDDVLSRTATFLDEETDLDGRAVVDAVEAGEYDEAVAADLAAATEGNLPRQTPALVLFREGEYVTTSGYVGWTTIEGSLS